MDRYERAITSVIVVLGFIAVVLLLLFGVVEDSPPEFNPAPSYPYPESVKAT